MGNAKYNSHLQLLKVAHGSVQHTFPHSATSSHILSPAEAHRAAFPALVWGMQLSFVNGKAASNTNNLQQPSKVKVTAWLRHQGRCVLLYYDDARCLSGLLELWWSCWGYPVQAAALKTPVLSVLVVRLSRLLKPGISFTAVCTAVSAWLCGIRLFWSHQGIRDKIAEPLEALAKWTLPLPGQGGEEERLCHAWGLYRVLLASWLGGLWFVTPLPSPHCLHPLPAPSACIHCLHLLPSPHWPHSTPCTPVPSPTPHTPLAIFHSLHPTACIPLPTSHFPHPTAFIPCLHSLPSPHYLHPLPSSPAFTLCLHPTACTPCPHPLSASCRVPELSHHRVLSLAVCCPGQQLQLRFPTLWPAQCWLGVI